jgi:predicted dehydrogenase
MHAPLHSARAETELTGIWSPSGRGVPELAEAHGVPAFRNWDDLLAASEAVDFAVPPQVQAGLAIEAARAGRAVMLEKPLGVRLPQATAVAEAVRQAGVANIVVLSKRFHPRTRAFLSEAVKLVERSPAVAVSARYVHGGFLGTGFLDDRERSGWRDDLGVLFDLGPHLLDLVELAGGRVLSVLALGDPAEALTVLTRHEGGATGTALLSGRVQTPVVLTDVEVYSHAGTASYTTRGMDHDEIWPVLRAEFASAVRTGSPVTVDVARALDVQRLVEAARLSLQTGASIDVGQDDSSPFRPRVRRATK